MGAILDAVAREISFLKRESLTSLLKYTRSDRWISTDQEGKMSYTEQATRGPRVCEFLTTPRGRIFSLLAFYSHF